MANIAKNIRLLRAAQNMTQDQLAEHLHVTRQTVSNYETGKSQPDVDTIIRLAEALQVDPNTLIYGIPTPPDRKREYIRMAIIAAMALVLAILALYLRNAEYESGPVVLKILARSRYIRPALYLVSGYGVMQLLSLLTELKPIKCTLMKIVLLIALAVYVFYTFIWNVAFPGMLLFIAVLRVVNHAPMVFLVPGAGLWLFRIKK